MRKIITSILIGSTVITMNAQNIKDNPLLKDWKGNYGGVPAFNEYKVSDFKEALEFAMKEKLNEVNAIANNPKPATFQNTIAALEKTGKRLSRVYAVYGIYSSNLSSPEFEPIEAEMEPKLAEVSDKITQNTKLFKRIQVVYNSKDKSKLTKEQQRLVKVYYDNYVYAGAKLDAKTKAKVSALNQQLAGLYTKFSQNLLSEENNQYVELKSVADFAGLPEELKSAAKANAQEHKLSSMGAVANTRSSVEPFLTYSSDRTLREKVWRMFVNRGDNGNAQDNNAIITQILKLRADRAKLMGFASHAHWKLSNTMAKDPANAMKLMMDIWKPAVAQVKVEVADMQKIIDAEGGNFKIQPWDYRYYAEKVRKEKYDLDQNEVKQYLQLDKLREGMFWVAGELFDLKFVQVNDVPVYQEDVTVYQVLNKSTNKLVGLWYFDPYARKGKRSGAWMNEYRMQTI